jgi:hypothetical protein
MFRIIIYFLTCVFFACLLITPTLSAATTPGARKTINILTWWGYLDHSNITTGAEKACGVKVSHDNYYSNDEFLRRWRQEKGSYDLVIFSNTIYKIVKPELPRLENSTLSHVAINYNPIIRSNYRLSNYPSNVVYFAHSLTGILYNTKKINVTNSDTVETLFQKAKNNIVVIIDDAVESSYLLSNALKGGGPPDNQNFNVENYNKMCLNADIYVGNGFTNIISDPNFSFSFMWSGEAIMREKKLGKDYRFIILPNISYISTDLLAETKKSKEADCVSEYLASKKNLRNVEINSYYFSPYADSTGVTHSGYADIYKSFLKSLSQLKWIKPVDPKKFDSLNQTWSFIKLSFINKINQRKE